MAADFFKAFEPHKAAIYKFIWRKARIKEDANDLFQETTVKAFEAYDKQYHGGNLRAWLYVIAKSVLGSFYRERKLALRLVSTEDLKPNQVPASHEPGFAAVEDREVVNGLIRVLSPDTKAAVQMYLDGYTPTEIGQRFNWSKVAAMARVSRAFDALRREYSAQAKAVSA